MLLNVVPVLCLLPVLMFRSRMLYLISGLSAQVSLKVSALEAKVICSFLPEKPTASSAPQRSQPATYELDPAPRPVLFGSQSVGSDDIFFKT